MAYDYGIPDAGSVLGQTPSYGSAAASLMPAPAAAPPADAFTPSKWKASWRNVGGVSDFYYEKSPGEWAPIPDDVRNSNSAQFGQSRVAALRAAETDRTTRAEQNQVNENAAERYRAEADLRNRELTARISNMEQSNKLGYAQLQQSGEANRGQLGLASQTLAANTDARDKDRLQQGEQFKATQEQQLLALQQANQTANRRLDIEDSHFSQQLAADKSARKLQAIMGISQSLAQLRI